MAVVWNGSHAIRGAGVTIGRNRGNDGLIDW
jgi:hypothetical protein